MVQENPKATQNVMRFRRGLAISRPLRRVAARVLLPPNSVARAQHSPRLPSERMNLARNDSYTRIAFKGWMHALNRRLGKKRRLMQVGPRRSSQFPPQGIPCRRKRIHHTKGGRIDLVDPLAVVTLRHGVKQALPPPLQQTRGTRAAVS
jgi:hypothetical protein